MNSPILTALAESAGHDPRRIAPCRRALEHLREELSGLAVPAGNPRGKSLEERHGRHVRPRATQETHAHRSLSTIEGILQKSTLANHVREHAAAIFRKLGEAEAAVHDVPIEKSISMK